MKIHRFQWISIREQQKCSRTDPLRGSRREMMKSDSMKYCFPPRFIFLQFRALSVSLVSQFLSLSGISVSLFTLRENGRSFYRDGKCPSRIKSFRRGFFRIWYAPIHPPQLFGPWHLMQDKGARWTGILRSEGFPYLIVSFTISISNLWRNRIFFLGFPES